MICSVTFPPRQPKTSTATATKGRWSADVDDMRDNFVGKAVIALRRWPDTVSGKGDLTSDSSNPVGVCVVGWGGLALYGFFRKWLRYRTE